MVIVDSTVWVDYFNGQQNPHTDWLDAQLDRQRFGLTSIILAEVLQGATSDRDARRLETELLRLEVFENVSAAIAIAAGHNYRKLRALGLTPRKTIDTLIATLCIESGHALLHRDRDFDPFEQQLGLIVVHPSRTASR
ncbi:MAG: PIN domain nuclease [Acidobacteria bacterium]|nr:PIN domain nuclease [Acidobacteriota bacterium]